MGAFETTLKSLFPPPGKAVPAAAPAALPTRYPEPRPCPLMFPQKMARVIPPVATHPLTIEGRTYSSRNGAALDVPLEDARVLAANSWLIFGLSGPMESRPEQPRFAEIFVETPAERVLQFDGKEWRDVHTGAVVK